MRFQRALPIAAVLLLMVFSALAGRVHALARLPETLPVTLVPDARPRTAVVSVTGVRGGVLRGSIAGDARVLSDRASADTAADGSFRLAVPVTAREEVVIPLPPGARFFASRQGRVYYPVTGRSGNTIKPQNRVYFPTSAEAEKAGYRAAR